MTNESMSALFSSAFSTAGGYSAWPAPSWSANLPDVLSASQRGALIDAVELQYQTASLGAMFGDSSNAGRYPVLGASLSSAIMHAGLNSLYANLIDSPLSGQNLADSLLYGFGNSAALDAATLFNRGSVINLLG